MKICHLQPRGWTQRLTYWGNKDRQRKNKISDDRPYMWHPKRNHTNEHIYKTETDSHTYTNLPGWGCCHPILPQIFRKEAGSGNPTLGEMETPWLFRLMWLFQPQTPLCFGVTRLVHIHKCKFIHYGCYRGITGHGGDRILRELAPTVHISWVQLLSRVLLFANLWTAACQASLSITNSRSLLKLMSIELVMSSNHLIPCHPLLLPAFNLFQHQGLFKWVSSSHQVAKVLEFQLQHQSFQWIFRTDFL